MYIARFARKWRSSFHAHAGMQALVVLLVIVSFSIIVSQINGAGAAHFATAHQVRHGIDCAVQGHPAAESMTAVAPDGGARQRNQVLGLIIFIVMLLQAIMGAAAHR